MNAVVDRSDPPAVVREQTREEEATEAIRRLDHLVRAPGGMTRTEIIREVRRVTRGFLKR